MKEVFNREELRICSNLIAQQYPAFNTAGFYNLASENLDERELKARSQQIFEALKVFLPADFATAVQILVDALAPVADNEELSGIKTSDKGVAGWLILPFSQYAGELGGEHLPQAMAALKQMTKRFSSEFGIRYLYLSHPEEALTITKTWLNDTCHHVRRLASEGCRPLLPWAMQLPLYKAEPERILPILEGLKSDSSEYVRRSVANNLNDIAKHHPDLVADVVRTWSKTPSKERQRLIKHASRTLIKQGHVKTLETFGYARPSNLKVKLSVGNSDLQLNDRLELELTLINQSEQAIKVLLDYVVYHQKANGKLAPKVFKWKELTLAGLDKITLIKKHHIKPISTRKYYPGEHQVAVQINGLAFSKTRFDLRL